MASGDDAGPDVRPGERATPTTGVLGGTFNPIHVGHLRAADEVLETLGLERILFIPSARPPHKRAGGAEPIAPASLRMEWTRQAVAGDARFVADSLEVDREGPSYLVDTLVALGLRLSPELPVFVLGTDAFREIETWRQPERLLELAHFAVATRPRLPHESPSERDLGDWLPEKLAAAFELAPDGLSARHRQAGTWIRVIEITALDVSASAIRAGIRAGRSVRYLLPEAIHDAVVASGCYQSPERPPREAREESSK